MSLEGIELTSMVGGEKELQYLRLGEANLVFTGGGGGVEVCCRSLCVNMGGGGCRFSQWEFHHLPITQKKLRRATQNPGDLPTAASTG